MPGLRRARGARAGSIAVLLVAMLLLSACSQLQRLGAAQAPTSTASTDIASGTANPASAIPTLDPTGPTVEPGVPTVAGVAAATAGAVPLSSRALATLTVLDGTVSVRSALRGTTHRATSGEALLENDLVRTATPGLAAITFFDGSEIALDDGSEIVLRELQPNAGSDRVIVVAQSVGITVNRVTQLSKNARYEVQTPNTTALVRGTDFTTRIRLDQQNRIVDESVGTTQGTVEVAVAGQAPQQLPAGELIEAQIDPATGVVTNVTRQPGVIPFNPNLLLPPGSVAVATSAPAATAVPVPTATLPAVATLPPAPTAPPVPTVAPPAATLPPIPPTPTLPPPPTPTVSTGGVSPSLGTDWYECETSTATVCGSLTRQGTSNTWVAVWENGATGTLTITQSGNDITMIRDDPNGLHGEYFGTLNAAGTEVSGSVTWCCDGFGTRSGTWTATIGGRGVGSISANPTPTPPRTASTLTLSGPFALYQEDVGCQFSDATDTYGTILLLVDYANGTASGTFDAQGANSRQVVCPDDGSSGEMAWAQTYSGSFSGTVDPSSGALLLRGTLQGSGQIVFLNCMSGGQPMTCPEDYSGTYSFPVSLSGTVDPRSGTAEGTIDVEQVGLPTYGDWSAATEFVP